MDGGRVPIFEAELLEDSRRVNLYGVLGATQDRGDVGIRLSLGDPEQHFGFAGRQPWRFKRFGGLKVGLQFDLRHRGLLFFVVAIQARVESTAAMLAMLPSFAPRPKRKAQQQTGFYPAVWSVTSAFTLDHKWSGR